MNSQNLKYLLYVVTERYGNAGRGIHSQVIEFDTLDEASAAKSEVMAGRDRFGEAIILSKTKSLLTKEDIFMELLKSNPIASVEDLWERSETAFKLITFNRI